MHRRQCCFYLLCIFITLSRIVAAECLACWSLHGVKVSTYKGDTNTGYVMWNPYWLSPPEKKWGLAFPKNMMRHMLSEKKQHTSLVIYKNIYWGRLPAPIDSTFLTSYEDIDTIKLSEINNIARQKGAHEALGGAGDMPIVYRSTVDLLQGEPLFQFKEETTVSDIFFLSYNENVNADSLAKIANSNWYTKKIEYEKCKIIIMEISYD